MKRFFRHIIAAPLYVVLALLLCFGSCQSSDNAGTREGASVASLPLTAQLGEASSRVSMSDTYGGAFSYSWNNDQLNIYHSYLLNHVVQPIASLSFGTTTTSGTTAKFSYSGAGAYFYNPSARIYAFSSGTGGGYTATVATDGTSTLTANTLASQNGTLTDCAKYDALYGSVSVNYSTGLPDLLTMHHLFGMLNFHLTSDIFSTSYPVTVTLTASATNILPGNSGTATFKADGSLNALTGSWGTSWSATVTPTTNGIVDVYLMTWPFTSTNGTVTVSCSDASGFVYTPLPVTISSLSLAAAQVKSKSLEINFNATPDNYSKLYAWDATDSQPVTVGTVPTNANITAIASDNLNHASYACKNCPNTNEISWYMSVDCYWDEGNISGGNTIAFKMVNGNTTKAGIWFRKKSGISGFSSTTYSGTYRRTPVVLTSDLATSLNLASNYFFLPAVGFTDKSTGAFLHGGDYGQYWSSTPDSNTTYAYTLSFANGVAGFFTIAGNRTYGIPLWRAQ